MGSFQTVFGGNNIAPALPTYIPLTVSTNILLGWPTELTAGGQPVLAEILDITATAVGLSLRLDDARESSTGYCALFNNVGANSFTVTDNLGNTLMVVPSGQVWQIYLADNSTQAGTWRVFQFGAGVSSANAGALAGAGLKAISTTLNENININQQSANYVIGSGPLQDRASLIEWTGGSGGVFTLPNPATVGSGWFAYVQNSGTGTLTVTPPSGTINGAASQVFQPFDSAIIVTDGINFVTLGFGRSVVSTFNFVQISLGGVGPGNYVLSGAQLNRISYRFTGALAGNVTVIVPGSIQQYWVDNETSGAFTLGFSAGGAPVLVAQGNRAILYCDGTNVINAVSIPAATAGGANTQVQYNNAGAFGGSSMTYQSGTGQFSIPASSSGATLNVGGLFQAGLFQANLNGAQAWNAGPGTSGVIGDISAYFYNDGPHFVNLTLTSVGYTASPFSNGPTGEQFGMGPAQAIPFSLVTNNAARITIGGTGNILINGATAGTTLSVQGDAAGSPQLQLLGSAGHGAYANYLDGNSGRSYYAGVGISGGGIWEVYDNTAVSSRLLIAPSGMFIGSPPVGGSSLTIASANGALNPTLNLATAGIGQTAMRLFATAANPVALNLDLPYTATGGGVASIGGATYPGVGAQPVAWVRVAVQGLGVGWMPFWV